MNFTWLRNSARVLSVRSQRTSPDYLLWLAYPMRFNWLIPHDREFSLWRKCNWDKNRKRESTLVHDEKLYNPLSSHLHSCLVFRSTLVLHPLCLLASRKTPLLLPRDDLLWKPSLGYSMESAEMHLNTWCSHCSTFSTIIQKMQTLCCNILPLATKILNYLTKQFLQPHKIHQGNSGN